MIRKILRCRYNIYKCFMYMIPLLFLEYVILRQNSKPHNARNEVIDSTNLRNMSQLRMMLNLTSQADFLSGVNNTSMVLPKGNVTSLTFDKSKLLLVQMQLTNCVQTKGDLSKCLEEAYLVERHRLIQDKVNGQKHIQPKQSIFRPANNKKTAPTIPPDDPVMVEKFYQKRTQKLNDFGYKLVLKPKRSCDDDTYVVILVHSFHPYEDRRQAIRESWGGAAIGRHPWPKQNITQKIKLIFMLGTHPQVAMNSAIQKESEKYDDIVQGDFFDAYVNMTLKSLLGLKYVSTYCKNVKFLLKSDDDMVINIPYLIDILKEANMNRSIMGPLNKGSKVYRSGKWKVSPNDYPFRLYPPYEAGSAYVITNDVIVDLFNASHYFPRFHVDDAYITGVLGKYLDVHHQEQKGFAFWTDKAPGACDIVTNTKISGTKMTPSKLRELWSNLQKGLVCS